MDTNLTKTENSIDKNAVRSKQIALAGLFAALSYIGFQFFRIDIPVGPAKTAFHLGNTFVTLAALFLGGPLGGLAGGAGLTIADLTSGYATSAPKTFFLKFMIALITGLVAHKAFKINQITDHKKLVLAAVVSSASGLLFNVFADPSVGYFYKRYLFGLQVDLAETLAKISALTTFVNAVASVAFASILYLILRPTLKKSQLI